MKAFILLGVLACATGPRAAAATEQAQPAAPPATTQTAPAPAPAAPVFRLKPVGIIKDVEQLTQSGTDPAVVKAYVQSWSTPYTVTANDILDLHNAGVPSDVLTTLIRHGAELEAQAAARETPPANVPAVAAPVSPVAPAVAPYPEPVTVAPTYMEPNYVYNYPEYVPYYNTVPLYPYSFYPFLPYCWPSYSIYSYYSYGRYRGLYDRGFRAYHSYPTSQYRGRSFAERSVGRSGFTWAHPIAGGPSWSGRHVAGGPSWGANRSFARGGFGRGGSFAGRSFAGGARGSVSARGGFRR
jgi:hypothetical protein